MNGIKDDIFKHDPDAPLVFHRKKILGLKGPFGILEDKQTQAQFNDHIIRLFTECEYTIITALIDKDWMLRQRHWRKNHPYHYLMEVLVEKYVQFLERQEGIGDIMPEARLGRADEALQGAFETVRQEGTDFVDAERMQAAIPSKNLKFRTKRDNIAGLQFCDLLAHPSHIYVRSQMGHDVALGPFATRIIGILLHDKYDRSHWGKIKGYGVKHFP
tara:strand:+ start:1506 stop:2153 length:648 start_codon:yes stop_codon:yes gene_type:complete